MQVVDRQRGVSTLTLWIIGPLAWVIFIAISVLAYDSPWMQSGVLLSADPVRLGALIVVGILALVLMVEIIPGLYGSFAISLFFGALLIFGPFVAALYIPFIIISGSIAHYLYLYLRKMQRPSLSDWAATTVYKSGLNGLLFLFTGYILFTLYGLRAPVQSVSYQLIIGLAVSFLIIQIAYTPVTIIGVKASGKKITASIKDITVLWLYDFFGLNLGIIIAMVYREPGAKPFYTVLVAIALAVIILYRLWGVQRRLNRSIFNMELFHDAGKKINSTLDFDEILDITLNECCSLFKLKQAAVVVADRRSSEILASAWRDNDGTIPTTVEFADSYFRPMLSLDDIVAIDDISQRPLPFDMPPAFQAGGAVLLAPLESEASVTGTIALHRDGKSDFSRDEITLVSNITTITASALENAHLYYMAMVDPMTGLYRRRFFGITLEDEWARSKRTGRPFAVLMADIDHFKRVNDTYGHDAGDRVLAYIAQVIMGNIRQIDTAARVGGEEFSILLTETGLETAASIADRIRLALAEKPVIYNGYEIPLTISIGVAAIDTITPENVERLLLYADEALYTSKHNGRNRVEVYHPA
ncbi:MAG: sensor domain-containing diguanylate cyclase [bacterium]|nr:sensor domain-containing diguanylate cyclase [bacterium]